MHRNSQFMERLFTLIMTGAYGLVMVWMFLSHYYRFSPGERSILSLVTTWIQYTIFIGGIFLLVLFVILLINLRRGGDGHHHDHDPDEKDHDCCDHDHGEHGHEHHHDHEHEHAGHECCDHGHDHNWNPIRYIPLLIPLILIMMGLPDTRMIENFERYRIDAAIKNKKSGMVNEQMCWMMMGAFSMPNEVFPQVGFSTTFASGVQSIIDELDDEAKGVKPFVTDLAELEKVVQDPGLMKQYAAYRKVELEGMFDLEETGAVSVFRVVRLRMACCLTDSRPAMILCATRKPLPENLNDGGKKTGTKWVKVQGRLKFMPGQDGKYQAFMKAVSVELAPMPPFPYLN